MGIAPDRPGPNAGRFFKGRRPLAEDYSPVILSISPVSAKTLGGGTITITGKNFNVDAVGTPSVWIGGVAATGVVVVDQNTITATIPARFAGLADLQVIDTRGRSSRIENAFNYVESIITSVAPGSGPTSGGSVVRITGVNFTPGATVTFGAVSATSITFIDDSHYVVTTPANILGPVQVRVDNATMQGGYFYSAEIPGSTLRRNPSVHVTHASNGPSTCQYSVDGQSGIPPKAGEEISILDQFGGELFAGVAQIVTNQFEELPENLRWDVAATDYVVWLNRRRPIGTYIQTSATDVIYDICGKFADWVGLDYVQTDLALIDIVFDGTKKFADCLNDVASLLGRAHWRMDKKALHFFRVPPPKVDSNTRPVKEIGVGPGTAPFASQSNTSASGVSYAPGYYAFRSSFLYGDGSYGMTVFGVNASGSTTLSLVFPGNPHPLLKGATILLVGGAAAGIYVVRQDTHINVGVNNIPLTYGLLGATTGSENVLIIVSESNPSPLSNLALMDGIHYPRLDNIAVGSSVGGLTVVGRRIYFQFFGLYNGVELGFYNEIPDNGTTTLISQGFVSTAIRGVPLLPQAAPPPGPQTAPNLGETTQSARDVLAMAFPSVGSLVSYSYQPGSYVLFVTYVYADGTESRRSPASNIMALTGKYALAVTAPVGQPVNGIPVVYRLIYGAKSGKTTEYKDIGATTFWGVIPDNTSAYWIFTPGLKKGGSQQPALLDTAVNASGVRSDHVDGPNPEDGSHPAEINDSNAYRLLKGPQLVSSGDVTEIYNRVTVIGRGVEIAPPVVLPPPSASPVGATGTIDPYANAVGQYADGTNPTAYISSHPDLKPWQGGYPMNARWVQLQKDYAARGLVTTQVPTPSSGGSAGSVVPSSSSSGGYGINSRPQYGPWGDPGLAGAGGVLGGKPYPVNPPPPPTTPSGAPPTTTQTSVDGVDHFKEYLASQGITPQFMMDHPYTVFMDLPENYYEVGGAGGSAGSTATAAPTIESLNDNAVTPVMPTVTRPMYQVDDLESQKYFGDLERDNSGNPSDGVHEIYLDGSALPSGSACVAYANAYLTLHAWPTVSVSYAVRESEHKPGRLIPFNLTNPPLKGTFAIQSVNVDQIRDESDAIVARYGVTASSVKFDLNDLLALIGDRSGNVAPVSAGANPLTIVQATTQARAEAKQLTSSIPPGVLVKERLLSALDINALFAAGSMEIVPGVPGMVLWPVFWAVDKDTTISGTTAAVVLRWSGTANDAALSISFGSNSTGRLTTQGRGSDITSSAGGVNPTGLGLSIRAAGALGGTSTAMITVAYYMQTAIANHA